MQEIAEPSPGRRLPERTRLALLEAGRDRFAALGFDGTTTDEIARHAGVNKATISYHFGGKEGLYRAILETILRPLHERLREIASAPDPPPVLLGRVLETLRSMAPEMPVVAAMILREAISGGRHLDENVLPHFLGVFGSVREVLRRGVRRGSFRPVDPLLVHLMLVGSVLFFSATTPFRERLIREGKVPVAAPPSPDQFLRLLGELLERGLAVGPDDRPGRTSGPKSEEEPR